MVVFLNCGAKLQTFCIGCTSDSQVLEKLLLFPDFQNIILGQSNGMTYFCDVKGMLMVKADKDSPHTCKQASLQHD